MEGGGLDTGRSDRNQGGVGGEGGGLVQSIEAATIAAASEAGDQSKEGYEGINHGGGTGKRQQRGNQARRAASDQAGGWQEQMTGDRGMATCGVSDGPRGEVGGRHYNNGAGENADGAEKPGAAGAGGPKHDGVGEGIRLRRPASSGSCGCCRTSSYVPDRLGVRVCRRGMKARGQQAGQAIEYLERSPL